MSVVRIAALGLLLAVIAVAAYGGLWAYRNFIEGGPAPGALTTVTIAKGSSVEDIGSALDRAGIVRSGTAWALKARLNGDDTSLRPGTYSLHRNERYDEIVRALQAGPGGQKAAVVRLTIAEGRAIRDIARDAGRVAISRKAYLAAVARARPPAGYRATGKERLTMEGFLFPSTYELAKPARAAKLVRAQLAAFTVKTAPLSFAAARRRKLTPYDVLIIASMIEREAANAKDRPLISAVIYNRLRQRIPLGIDATIQYRVGSWRPLTAADLKLKGRYNTRTSRGLPPTPICNPGIAALQAAAHPAKVDYRSYVAIPRDPGRRHFFTKSNDAFLAFQRAHPA